MSRTNLPPDTMEFYMQEHPIPPPLTQVANPLAVLQEQAIRHEQNRLETVAELLGIVAIMASRRLLGGQEVVTVGGAVYQFGHGTRSARAQAAHCLPGQIKFDGQPLHEAANWTPAAIEQRGLKPLHLASKLRNLSGLTDLVDVLLNEADSSIEKLQTGRGLKRVLADTARELITTLHHRKSTTWDTVGTLVLQAMEYYRLHAGYVCTERLVRLRIRLSRSSNSSIQQALQQKIHIIHHYEQLVSGRSYQPTSVKAFGFRQLVADLVKQENGHLLPPLTQA